LLASEATAAFVGGRSRQQRGEARARQSRRSSLTRRGRRATDRCTRRRHRRRGPDGREPPRRRRAMSGDGAPCRDRNAVRDRRGGPGRLLGRRRGGRWVQGWRLDQRRDRRHPQHPGPRASQAVVFTDKTDIKVNYTILEEGTLREVITRDVPGARPPVRRGDDRPNRGRSSTARRATSPTSRARPPPAGPTTCATSSGGYGTPCRTRASSTRCRSY
jgi:hypothetical protein